MKHNRRDKEKIARLAEVSALLADASRIRAARALRDDSRHAKTVDELDARRATAISQIDAVGVPDPAFAASTAAWLRWSEEERRRLMIQQASLRARAQTMQREAARAIARRDVLERLAKS